MPTICPHRATPCGRKLIARQVADREISAVHFYRRIAGREAKGGSVRGVVDESATGEVNAKRALNCFRNEQPTPLQFV
jgi:hypothetical protein